MEKTRESGNNEKERKGSWSKLFLFSAVIVFILSLIVFATLLFNSINNSVLLLNKYIEALPNIIDERVKDAKTQEDFFLTDMDIRGNLAVLLYQEYDDLELKERLQLIRDVVSAESISLLDAEGKVLESTDTVLNKLPAPEILQEMMTDESRFMGLPSGDDPDNKASEEADPPVYLHRISEGDDHWLAAVFENTQQMDVSHLHFTMQMIVERLLSGRGGVAFIRYQDEKSTIGYPFDSFSKEELDSLENDIINILRSEVKKFMKIGITPDRETIFFHG